MREDDWSDDLYGSSSSGTGADGAESGATNGDEPSTERRALASVSPGSRGTVASAAEESATPDIHWGSRAITAPFEPEKKPATEKTKEPGPEIDGLPPKPVDPPTNQAKEPVSLKDRLKSIKGKASKAKEATAKAKTKVTETVEKTAPARKGVSTAFQYVAPSKGGSWSFVWALAAAWVISPQTVASFGQRFLAVWGADTGPRLPWNLMAGPGEWFRDTWQQAWETHQQWRILVMALIGIGPILVAQFSEKIQNDRSRKILGWIAYGTPVFWVCSVSYIPAFGYHNWNEVYTTALFAAAWWCFCAARKTRPGFIQFLLWIPLASVLCGILAYSPGAAF